MRFATDYAEVVLNIVTVTINRLCACRCAYMTGRVKMYVNTALELISRCILERERERGNERKRSEVERDMKIERGVYFFNIISSVR